MRHRVSGTEVARSRTRLQRTDINLDGSVREYVDKRYAAFDLSRDAHFDNKLDGIMQGPRYS